MKKRLAKLQDLMKEFDCLILTSPQDIYYYSGYMPLEEDGSVLVVLRDGANLFTTRNGYELKSASVRMTTMERKSDFSDFIKGATHFALPTCCI